MKNRIIRKLFPCLLGLMLVLVVFFVLPTTASADIAGVYNIKNTYLNLEVPYGYREAIFTAQTNSDYYYVPEFTGNDGGHTFYNGISWYDETTQRYLAPGDTFRTGRIYTLRVIFQAEPAAIFSTHVLSGSVTVVQGVTPHLNGEEVSLYHPNNSIYYYSGICHTFEACPAPPAEIRSVNIVDLDTPFDLAKPDYSATAEGPNYSVDTVHSIQPFSYINGVCWIRELGNGYTYQMSHSDASFERQNIYTVRIIVKAEYPYRFLLSSDGTKPDISAYIKGYRCEVEPAIGYDPYYYCILKYTFPACPYGLTRLNVAQLTDVEVPRAGATPDYNVTPMAGFSVVDDEDTVIKNGITWYDKTDGKFLKPTDTFIKGHEYTISAYLEASEGYLFQDDEDGNCLTEASVNGGASQAQCSMGGAPNRISFSYTFPPAVDPDPVKITAQPKTSCTKQGVVAKTTVTAAGVELKYQWFVKNAGATGWSRSSITTSTYSVKMTAATKDRQVYCVVTDKFGNTAKTETVYLRMAATVTTQPKTTYTKQGATAKTSVTAVGDGLKYQWFVKNAGATKWSESSITTNTYSVKMSATTKDRQVYCMITDKYGKTVQTETVYLRMAATVTAQPKTTYTKQGATAKTSVTAVGDGLKYQWFVKNAGATKWSKSSITANTYSVKMSATTKDRQVYCVITDKYGKTVQTETVYLRMAATVTKQPDNVAVTNGTVAKTSVTAVGDGLTYQWYVKNAGATKWSKSSITANTYSVKMTSAVNGRQIYCVITDKYGNTVKTETATLYKK